jgi:hypothetical protein
LFQSTPPARGATIRRTDRGKQRNMRVSIHAPRAGGDRLHCARRLTLFGFNPRPPRGGRRSSPGSGLEAFTVRTFQSTPPARGATAVLGIALSDNPRPPLRGATAGGYLAGKFQSTPPARGATRQRRFSQPCPHHRCFNPRPPRGGRPFRERNQSAPDHFDVRFNPRPPRGGRRSSVAARCGFSPFQSTPPARGATVARLSHQARRCVGFNPRPPRGGRPNDDRSVDAQAVRVFQSTPPARGATAHVVNSSMRYR